jgi:Vta1 like
LLGVQGLGFENRSPKINGVLRALVVKLEKDKPKVGLGEGDREYCENFALTIFNRADKVDRAGRADKSTAMTFYAASVFLEVNVPLCGTLGHQTGRTGLCVERTNSYKTSMSFKASTSFQTWIPFKFFFWLDCIDLCFCTVSFFWGEWS